MLAEHVTVERRFQRSIRLDADLGSPDALQGYVLHASASTALATTSRLLSEGQGAFTWTGPYGGGKSSLALALASALSIGDETRDLARTLLDDALQTGFGGRDAEWLPVVVTGRRGNPVSDLREAVADAVAKAPGKAQTRRSRKPDPGGRDVIARLVQEATLRTDGGVLVIIDEMGKYLEGAGDRNVDIHFFQDLAEAANRSSGRLFVVGVLHQAFERYAERLGSAVQDEWAKIQGRFVDVPIVTAIDEVIDLLGRAVTSTLTHPQSAPVAGAIAQAIAVRRPGTPDDLSDRLDRCWPLHPVTAALLGPVTRRRFGQNERSLFGFLGSAEPAGFREFLDHAEAGAHAVFEPADLWDYLRINYEPAIQASPDGHRWAQAVDAVERAERAGSALGERMAKTVAVIDLFRNGSGVMASPDVLATCGGEASQEEVATALGGLVRASALVFRRHVDAYAVYAGSDFDIEAEIAARMTAQTGLDMRELRESAELRPVLAKAHHFRTGTPRWFATSLAVLGSEGLASKDRSVPSEAAGRFILAMPEAGLPTEEARALIERIEVEEGDRPVVVGFPPNADLVRTLSRELAAVRDVRRDSPELEGDQVARREIEAREAYLAAKLEGELRAAFDGASWVHRGHVVSDGHAPLSRLASVLADKTFAEAPVIHSELANRSKPSSNTNAAIRALLAAMAEEKAGQPRLGLEGYPPEVGLLETVLVATGLYQEQKGTWSFAAPQDGSTPGSLGPLWRHTDEALSSGRPVALSEIYDLWARPPFGLRRGVMPILAVAYLLTRRTQTAVYVEEMFQPALTDLITDRLLQNPADVAFRQVAATAADRAALSTYAKIIESLTSTSPTPEPLPVAQALVAFAFRLPGWARHARGALSDAAVRVRHALLHADDPHDLFAVALPTAVGEDDSSDIAVTQVGEALQELASAYSEMLSDLQAKMLAALKHRGRDFEPLQARAAAIGAGAGDDLKLAGFVARLARFEGGINEMEAICGLVTGQPVSTWRDLEPGRAAVQLADYAYRFRRIELFGDAGEAPTQTAVMMMAGVGDAERSVVRRAQISVTDKEALRPLVEEIEGRLKSENLDQDRLLAVLADVAHDLLEDDGEADVSLPLVETRGDGSGT
jgi:hypothetical protein